MATLVLQKRLLNEVQRGKKLSSFLRYAIIVLFLALGVGLLLTFHTLNKNIEKNNSHLASLKKEFESYQSSQSEVQEKFNNGFKSLVQDVKTLIKDHNNMQRSFDIQTKELPQRFAENHQMFTNIEKELAFTALGLKMLRDEMKLRLEAFEDYYMGLKQNFDYLNHSQSTTQEETQKILSVLESLKSQRMLEVLEPKIAQPNFFDKNILNQSEGFQSYEENIKNSGEGPQNLTIVNFKRNGNETSTSLSESLLIESTIDNKTQNDSSEETSKVMSYHPQSEEPKKQKTFSSLLMDKANAVKEFVSKKVGNVIQKWNSPKNISLQALPESKETNKTNTEKRSATQIVAKGFSAVKKYVGDSFNSLFGKEKIKTDDTAKEVQNTTIEVFESNHSVSNEGKQKDLMNILEDLFRKAEGLKENELEQDKTIILDLELLLKDLDFTIENFPQNLSKLPVPFKKWKRNYDGLKQVYETTKEILLEENNYSHTKSLKKLPKQVQKFLTKIDHLKQMSLI